VLQDLQKFEAKSKEIICQKSTTKSMPVELAKLPVKNIKEIELKSEAVMEEKPKVR
jgi:hypothetical protein